MSVSANSAGALVLQSSGLGANSLAMTINAPSSLAQATTLSLGDPGVAACNVQLGVANVVSGAAAADTALTAAQSGSLVQMAQATANVNITLPSTLVAGLNYKIMFKAVSDGTHTQTLKVADSSAKLCGQVFNFTAATPGVCTSSLTPASTIVRSATAANTGIGDYIDVFCDGAKYHCRAMGIGAAATYTIT